MDRIKSHMTPEIIPLFKENICLYLLILAGLHHSAIPWILVLINLSRITKRKI